MGRFDNFKDQDATRPRVDAAFGDYLVSIDEMVMIKNPSNSKDLFICRYVVDHVLKGHSDPWKYTVVGADKVSREFPAAPSNAVGQSPAQLIQFGSGWASIDQRSLGEIKHIIQCMEVSCGNDPAETITDETPKQYGLDHEGLSDADKEKYRKWFEDNRKGTKLVLSVQPGKPSKGNPTRAPFPKFVWSAPDAELLELLAAAE